MYGVVGSRLLLCAPYGSDPDIHRVHADTQELMQRVMGLETQSSGMWTWMYYATISLLLSEICKKGRW